MPAPVWNWAPRRQDGRLNPGFDRRSPGERRPSEQLQWQPAPTYAFPYTTEVDGAMLTSKNMQQSGYAGMGDFFVYPQGDSPQSFIDQQVQSGAMPPPQPFSPAGSHPFVAPDKMDEASLFRGGMVHPHAGAMPWEAGPAPWEQTGGGAPGLPPGAMNAAIAAMNRDQEVANEKKAAEAAQAAKIAADNAVRAAVVGAPKTATTNAATAQAAANVAAGVARTPKAQKAAAFAQSEATKAVAAANVAEKNAHAKNAASKETMDDWMELSGMGFFGPELGGGVTLGHVLVGLGVAAVGYFGYRKLKG